MNVKAASDRLVKVLEGQISGVSDLVWMEIVFFTIAGRIQCWILDKNNIDSTLILQSLQSSVYGTKDFPTFLELSKHWSADRK